MPNTQQNPSQVMEALQSSEHEVIRSAAFAAGEMQLQEATPLLCQHIKSDSIGVQEAAEFALRKIRGPQVVAALLPLLNSDDAPVRNVSMDILREIGSDGMESLQTYLHDDDVDLRIFISDILGYCRTPQAIALLNRALLKDPEVNVRYQAAVSLGNLASPESVDALCQAVHDEEWVQFAAVEALAKIKDHSAVSGLVKLLPQATPLVSSAIIDALGDLGDVKSIPLLFNSLENVTAALRHKIVKAIVQILTGRSLALLTGKSKERLRTYLVDALTETDDDVLLAALEGLAAIGNADCTEAVINRALSLDAEREQELYEAAIQAIASIGYNDTVRDALRSDDEQRILVMMDVCRLMNDHRTIDELKKIYWRANADIARAAIAIVAQLADCTDMSFFMSVMEESNDAEALKNVLIFLGNQPSCPEVDELVFSQIDHRYIDVKEMALEACINLASPALNARFKERAWSDDAQQRMMAIYALGRYNLIENLHEITSALSDESPRVRQVAVEAFQNIGSQAGEYLSLLVPLLEDPEKDVRLALVDVLGHIGAEAIPHVMNALRDENDWVKIRAMEALGAQKIAECVPVLAQILENGSPIVALKSIETLGKIGGNIAFGVLLGIMSHEDPEIQHAAADAVAAIQAEQE